MLYLTPAATALWAVPMFGAPLRAGAVLGLLISAMAVVLLRTRRVSEGGECARHRTGGR